MELLEDRPWIPQHILASYSLLASQPEQSMAAPSRAADETFNLLESDLGRWKKLMRDSQGGSEQAYRMLLTEFGAWLDSIIETQGFEPNSERLTSDVLKTVHLKRHTYRKNQCIASWLLSILQHRLVHPLEHRVKY